MHSTTDEIVALHECVVRLLERTDIEELFREVVERAAALAGTEHACLYLLDGPSEIALRVGTGVFALDRGVVRPRESGLSGRVLDSGRTVVVDDYRVWNDRRSSLAEAGVRATVGVPISDGTGLAGVLGLAYTDDRRFDETQLGTLERFAQLASLALENARLLEGARSELRERRTAEEELTDAIARLRRSEHELQRSQEEMITRLANAAESRSAETGRHVQRMSIWCARLARHLGLDEEVSDLIRRASPLHDIGKLAIPDQILLKPASLTTVERAVIETHAEIGYRLLNGSSMEMLDYAASIAWTHHERFDGNGYPRGLAGPAIPLEGRIAAVADVFDALTSDRAYRPALTAGDAIEIVKDGRGTAFDPVVVDAFLDVVGTSPGEEQATGPRGRRPKQERRRAAKLTERQIASAVEAALAALRRESGTAAIDAALTALSTTAPSALVSVYAMQHDRLWLVSQCGYSRVRDGFGLDQGILGRAGRTRQVQFVEDIHGDGDFLEAVDDIESEVSFPLLRQGELVGVFNVETRGTRLPRAAASIFQLLADALEQALESIDDVASIDLAHLAHMCVYASSLRGVAAISEFAARMTGRLLDLTSAQVNLAADGGLRLAAYWSRTSETGAPFSSDRLAELSLLAPETIAFNTFADPAGGREDEEIVWLPLRSAGSTVGAIVGRRADTSTLSQARVEAATLFGQQIAALLDVAQALRRERRAATTDALTGLLNRRGFDGRLREELEYAEASGETLTMLLLDCDRLAELNETHGHELGDAFLQAIANAIRSEKRTEDAAARISGDEFALLLPHTDASGAQLLGERLMAAVARATGDTESRTVSIGIASAPPYSADELMRAADAALYSAKAAGGSRIHANLFHEPT
ncbi:MAG: diguanylate cyclase [Actinobacteria bacterium]|nr:diguanylate cyclase [Actinomycetota bacterium]